MLTLIKANNLTQPFVYLGPLCGEIRWFETGIRSWWSRNCIIRTHFLYFHSTAGAGLHSKKHFIRHSVTFTLSNGVDLEKSTALTTMDGFNFWLIVKLYMRQPGRLAARCWVHSAVDNKPLIYSPDRCVFATNWTHLMWVSFQTLTITSWDENSFHFRQVLAFIDANAGMLS